MADLSQLAENYIRFGAHFLYALEDMGQVQEGSIAHALLTQGIKIAGLRVDVRNYGALFIDTKLPHQDSLTEKVALAHFMRKELVKSIDKQLNYSPRALNYLNMKVQLSIDENIRREFQKIAERSMMN